MRFISLLFALVAFALASNAAVVAGADKSLAGKPL